MQMVTSHSARFIASILCLVSLCLIGGCLVFIVILFGSDYDFPPTWYWALTILLSALDAVAMCYIAFQSIRVLTGRAVPSRLLRIMAVIVALIVASHAAAVYAYSNIPRWDFQDGLFDDLSRPPPGKVSSNCTGAGSPAGRRAWIYNVSHHRMYDNPEHRVLSVPAGPLPTGLIFGP